MADLPVCNSSLHLSRAAKFRITAKLFDIIYSSLKKLLLCLSGREVACNAGDTGDAGSIPGPGRSPQGGNGNSLQYSCLEILWTEEPGDF